METSGRDYPGIVQRGAVFNMSRLIAKGVTLLRDNASIKINNNCAIQFGLKKLTRE